MADLFRRLSALALLLILCLPIAACASSSPTTRYKAHHYALSDTQCAALGLCLGVETIQPQNVSTVRVAYKYQSCTAGPTSCTVLVAIDKTVHPVAIVDQNFGSDAFPKVVGVSYLGLTNLAGSTAVALFWRYQFLDQTADRIMVTGFIQLITINGRIGAFHLGFRHDLVYTIDSGDLLAELPWGISCRANKDGSTTIFRQLPNSAPLSPGKSGQFAVEKVVLKGGFAYFSDPQFQLVTESYAQAKSASGIHCPGLQVVPSYTAAI